MSKKHPMINSALRRAGDKFGKDIALSNGDVVKMSPFDKSDEDFREDPGLDDDQAEDANEAIHEVNKYLSRALDALSFLGDMPGELGKQAQLYYDDLAKMASEMSDTFDEV